MFLALKEINYSKARYILVIGVLFLIAYLVFFLTGLAYGLAQENRLAVDKWQADAILLSTDANDNLGMSMIEKSQYGEVQTKEKAVLAQTPAVVSKKNTQETINVSFFGIDPTEFLAPNLVSGQMFEKTGEAVVDNSLQEEYGLALGDQLKVSGSDMEVTIVGFTTNAKFNVAPVLYVSLGTYQQIRFEKTEDSENTRISAIVVRGAIANVPSGLSKVSISTFIDELPGYYAQVLTFSFMIGFLIVIASIVIGIFVYVLTMQKTEIFGVMKAQGISSSYIAKSVIDQTFILTALGVGIGLLMTFVTAYALPAQVPFAINGLFLLVISLLMLLFAVLGAFFSVRAVVKIDPLKAIG